MIHVTQATFLTYDGQEVEMEFKNMFFHEPKWKVKELLLDRFANFIKEDPIVKIVSLKYKEYGKED